MLPLGAGAALLAALCVAAAAAAGTPARADTAAVSGAPYAWGDNSVGELGDGTTTQHDSPEVVTLATGITSDRGIRGRYLQPGEAWSDSGRRAPATAPRVRGRNDRRGDRSQAAAIRPPISAGTDGLASAPTATCTPGATTPSGVGDGTTTQHDSPEVMTLAAGVQRPRICGGIRRHGDRLRRRTCTPGAATRPQSTARLKPSESSATAPPPITTPPRSSHFATGVKPSAVSAGTAHTLAIGSDGKLYAWGFNGDGSLGDGSTTQHDSPEVITLVAGVKPTAVSAGPDSSVAIGSDGKLYAWGDNTFGELGDGTTTSHNSPEVITLAAGVKPTAVSAAGFDGMAIGSDGNLYAGAATRPQSTGRPEPSESSATAPPLITTAPK